MNFDSLVKIINSKLVDKHNIPPLNTAQIQVLQGIWQYQTYTQIAMEAGYSPSYFTNIVAPELCQRLSKLVGERVTKKNCRLLLESYVAAQQVSEAKSSPPHFTDFLSHIQPDSLPLYPSGAVPLDSPFYINRFAVEKLIDGEIREPGALVRIKAPREMGKTSLLVRILDKAKSYSYCTVSLNLEQIDQDILSDLNKFLRSLCTKIALQLQLKPSLDEYWDEDLGSKMSCTLYFQDYLLKLIDTPLVLAFDEVNHIFEHPKVAKDFLALLRSWYEEAKTLPVWQKLRLIVVHSTEIYIPLQLNQSPFNVGLPIQLGNFSLEEVQQLAQRYGLNWVDGLEARQLMSLVGGHPALINLALYHLSRSEITRSQLLEISPTATEIYHHHLQRHWITLQEEPELAQALDLLINTTEPFSLDPIVTHKLSSMGLIKLDNNKPTLSCQLYLLYFQNQQLV